MIDAILYILLGLEIMLIVFLVVTVFIVVGDTLSDILKDKKDESSK